MLFLLNDRVLHVDERDLNGPLSSAVVDRLTPECVEMLGAELFAAEPLLHTRNPDLARKLAVLIAAKHPGVNAAHFFAEAEGCDPETVEARFASLDAPVLRSLKQRQADGALTPLEADQRVWRRYDA